MQEPGNQQRIKKDPEHNATSGQGNPRINELQVNENDGDVEEIADGKEVEMDVVPGQEEAKGGNEGVKSVDIGNGLIVDTNGNGGQENYDNDQDDDGVNENIDSDGSYHSSQSDAIYPYKYAVAKQTSHYAVKQETANGKKPDWV